KNNPKPVKGSKEGVCVSDDDLQSGLDNYYAACGWTADGIPTIERLKQIGLGALSYISENAIASARAQEEN
ncbi:MAG: aldehyde ferredoxin oxidoreductase C-terminal domain-containing protein, partial [Nitrososphaerota archaeon]|nr:aldehyde ferredoxin oxidoreductase C-terminal domain-containing protein [Nitrososphaerota archaeon]